METFKPAEKALFFSRQDPKDPRLGDLVAESLDGKEGVTILGYPDDEGIRLNRGREGAAAGPREIRNWLYRMTPHPKRHLKPFCDGGDLNITGDLAARHETVATEVARLLKSGSKVLSFGGGNDWAYADGIAFLRECGHTRPLVINIDAHLDVRPSEQSLNSGTPFYRLLESGLPFDFVEFGIQTHCNSKAHWEYVQSQGGRILTIDEYLDSGLSLLEFTARELGDWMLKRRPCFLALDIDAFALPLASGSSAAWPLGLMPQEFWPLYLMWLQRLDVRVTGIYEVSPPLDVASATAKWAAQLAHGFLHDV